MIDWEEEFKRVKLSKTFWYYKINLDIECLFYDILEFLKRLFKGELK